MRTAPSTSRFLRIACRDMRASNRRSIPRLTMLENRLAPAVFTVNSELDDMTGTGNVGTLRYCLSVADTNGVADTINIEFASAKTILLGSELSINDLADLTITVPAGKAAATIDGQQASRLFSINTTSLVTLSNLTMTRGFAPVGQDGGAINVAVTAGNLTVLNSVISNSSTNTSATGECGGAISLATNGNLILKNSTITGNTANKGGGVYFFTGGSCVIDGCTFTQNVQKTSSIGGGGLYFRGAVLGAGFTISNSTFHANSSAGFGGGIRIRQAVGTLTIRNSTITGNVSATNGGGVYITPGGAGATLDVISSVIAENVNNGSTTSPDIFALAPTVVRLNNSAIGFLAGFVLDTANSKNNQSGIDFKLGPLASNGGPTQTRVPLAGSTLREQGSNPLPALTTDQRGVGFTRQLGSAVDIGAVESVDPAPSATLSQSAAIVSAGATPNTVTLTYSDSQSNINFTTIDSGDIQITQVKTGAKVTITSGVPDVAGNGNPRQGIYTFTPPGGAWDSSDNGEYQVTLLSNQVFDTDSPTPAAAASGLVGSFRVEIPVTYVVDIATDENDGNTGKGDLSLREALTLANADAGSADIITFDPTVFAANQTILLTLGQLDITDNVTITGPSARVTLDANSASRVLNISLNSVPGLPPANGRPVAISNLIIQNGRLLGETGTQANTQERGAGIFIKNEVVTITNCLIRNNTAQGNGGGLFLQSVPGQVTIIDSAFTGNSSNGTSGNVRTGCGGAIGLNANGVVSLVRSTLAGNSATHAGGGIYFYSGGSMDLTNCTISGNTADGVEGGGGVYFFGTVTKTLSVTNSTVSGNKAPNGAGGGIILQTLRGTGTLVVSNSTFVFNEAGFGGAIARVGGASTIPLNMTSTIVAKNSTTQFIGTDIFLDPTASDIPGNNNLVGVNDDGGFVLTGTNNQSGTGASPLDPAISVTLANNGGSTFTHALLAGSPAINAGSNPSALATDQRGFKRDVGVTDIGAFEVQAPAKVSAVTVNDGSVQRSRVTSLTVVFDSVVTFTGAPASSFQLTRQSPAGAVNLAAAVSYGAGTTTVVLTFSGGLTESTSLADGRYDLLITGSTVIDSQGGALDGDANGSAGGNFSIVGSPANAPKLYRLFGDVNADGKVDAVDFGQFRSAFNTASPNPSFNAAFDFNNDGKVDAVDFGAFRQRFNTVI